MTLETHPLTINAFGIPLAGELRLPHGSGPHPGLVFTGPFTGVKEQVVAIYATALAERGYATLTFDHRNFGASGGARRQHEDAMGKLDDLLAATSALAEHPDVDAERVGVVGVCMGGGYALRHAAFDPRVKALGVVAAAFNDPADMQAGMGTDGYRAVMADLAEVAAAEVESGEIEYINAVSENPDVAAAMPGQEPFDYYGTDRSAAPGWRNQITRLSIRELLTFDAAKGADFLGETPFLVVHGRTDDFCSPEAAARIVERSGDNAEIRWLDTTNHIDLYDNPKFVEPAIDHLTAWFDQHLASTS